MWYVITSLQGEEAHDLIDAISDDFNEGIRRVVAHDMGEATEGLVFGPWYASIGDIPLEGNYNPCWHEMAGYYVTWDGGYGWLTLYGFDENAGKD